MHDGHLKRHRCYALLAGATLLSGCGGLNGGGDIRVPLSQQQVLQSEDVTGSPLVLPGNQTGGFNIHVKKSSQIPGPDGRPDETGGSSDATADGQAFCQAKASNGGAASAEFTMGHRIANRTGSAQSVQIQITYQLRQSMEAPSVPGARTLGTADMELLVVDSQKRNVAKMTVIHATSDEVTGGVSSQDQRTVSVRFEPDRWYDIMLCGRVHAGTEANEKILTRLDVQQLKMHLTFAPAATQPAAP